MADVDPMSPAMLELVAEQFRALSEPSRLRLMSVLFAGEHTVSELVAASELSTANVSKHLAVLHQAGWVERRKVGVTVRYSLQDPRARALCELMCDRVQARTRAAAEASGVRI